MTIEPLAPIDFTETTLSSETVYLGRLLQVNCDRVSLPNGAESTREYIVHPGAVVVLPVFDNGDVLLERQYRYPLRRDFIEFPAGKIDPGEDEMQCGQRELREETGYEARQSTHVTTLYPSIGYANERLEFFHAQQLEFVGHARDSDEFLEVLRVPFNEAMAWLSSGKICETKTVVGLFWLEQMLRQV